MKHRGLALQLTLIGCTALLAGLVCWYAVYLMG